jgi:hypothetical protein
VELAAAALRKSLIPEEETPCSSGVLRGNPSVGDSWTREQAPSRKRDTIRNRNTAGILLYEIDCFMGCKNNNPSSNSKNVAYKMKVWVYFSMKVLPW